MSTKLIGVNELAETLGVPPSWIYARTRLKGPDTIPHLKVGKYVKFKTDPERGPVEVMEWIQAQNEAH